MPAYNFKARFAAAVQAGRKRQTIRPRRKRPIQAGDQLYLYTGMRTKACRKLLEAPCQSVVRVELDRDEVRLGGYPLPAAAWEAFAQADGFASFEEMIAWFDQQYGLPAIDLELIRW
jgi:hypothetical protein